MGPEVPYFTVDGMTDNYANTTFPLRFGSEKRSIKSTRRSFIAIFTVRNEIDAR